MECRLSTLMFGECGHADLPLGHKPFCRFGNFEILPCFEKCPVPNMMFLPTPAPAPTLRLSEAIAEALNEATTQSHAINIIKTVLADYKVEDKGKEATI
jgi:hypothetical protein